MTIDNPTSPEHKPCQESNSVDLEIEKLLEIARHARQYDGYGKWETSRWIEACALKIAESRQQAGAKFNDQHAREISQQITTDLLDRNNLDDLFDTVANCALQNKRQRIKNFLTRYRPFFVSGILALVVGFMGYQFFFPSNWRASYFANNHLSGKPFGVYFEGMPQHDWADASSKPGMPNDYFSIRWESDMVLSEDSELEFTTISDDGVRLYLDSEILINRWIPLNSEISMAQRTLKAGRYRIKLEYFDQERAAKISLKISSPDGKVPKFEVPS